MKINVATISEAVSAMEAARLFISLQCPIGGGRVDHFIRLDNAASELKQALSGITLKLETEATGGA